MKSESRVLFVLCAMAVTFPLIARADEPSATTAPVAAPADTADYKKLYEDQKKKTDELERRVSILEETDKAAPYVKTEDVTEPTLNFLQNTEVSGYASASYSYNFNSPASGENMGRGFDVRHDEFMANKLVVRITKPVEYNAFDWTAGYAGTLIFGQDAEFTQAVGLSLGDQGDLFEANLMVNVPIGSGLKIIFGKYGTTIGYESSFSEETYNWSGGNQWTFLEPFTHTGVMLSYAPNDQWEVQILVNNGWDIVADNNGAKSLMGTVSYIPNDKTEFYVTGYGGPEQDDNTSNWRKGIDVVLDHHFTPKLDTVVQLDYGAEDGADINGGIAEWFAAGVWVIYDFTEKVQGALRVDYLNDRDGARTSDAPALAPFPFNTGQELTSVTFTLNFKPIENVRIAPEIRWDRSTIGTVFDGQDNQVTGSIGAVVSF